jgi:serine/threonine-protein kinase
MAGMSLSTMSLSATLAQAAQRVRGFASGHTNAARATTEPTEDATRFLQARLVLLHEVGFGISVAFLVGILGIRGLLGGSIFEEVRSPSRGCHIAATVGMGVLWLFLKRAKPKHDTLALVDSFGILALSLLLNLNAGLFEVRTVAVFNLALTTGTAMVLRAVIVPSSARRTLLLGLVASTVAIAIFFFSALHPAWPVRHKGPTDWPLSFQLISLALWTGALVAIATVASRVIYGLQREVRAARMLGQYVLGDKIGEGGMGVVYRATHAMLRRETAIKLLHCCDRQDGDPGHADSSALRRFEREVIETARLRHPNTVAIFDYGRTLDGIFYYAMEYLDGVTIAQLVDDEGPVPPGRVVHILAQVCGSLDEAHSLGLVHRDIKPSNIMLVGHPGAFDLVKVLDFGLVRTVATDGAAPSMSSAGVIVGTPRYLAPEAITDPEEVDGRSDLYALGAVGYYLLTGGDLFEGSSIVEICAAHLYEKPVSIRERLGTEVPPDLEALVLRCLSKKPADRPSSAAELGELLLACNVPPWTPKDAHGWWQMHRGREAHPARLTSDVACAPTVRVELAER